MTTDHGDFASAQARAAHSRRTMLEERQAYESGKAAGFLRLFVEEARTTGLSPVPLVVTGYGGRGSAKTNLKGWYLKADRTLAVDTDGNYYILITELPALSRFRTQTIAPSPPPLILSKGGRDGESMDLTAKLDELLPTWRQGGQGSLDPVSPVGRS